MSLLNTRDKAYLMLANGRIFEGCSFGVKGTTIGEIVFSTSMVGYQEALTDTSYYGQLLIQTFPLIGNYGINDDDYESEKVSAKGYIVRECCDTPSNFRSNGNLDEFMKKFGVVGISDIDTRCLTRIIRENGIMNGVITTENVYDEKVKDEFLRLINEYKIIDAVKNTTLTEKKTYLSDNAEYNLAMLDLGFKNSILKDLLSRKCNVTVFPAFTSADEILASNPDGIVYSNGSGNPNECAEIIDTIKALNEKKLPSFGIDLGHILMAMASGASIQKLKYGHHGANQPVLCHETGKTFVTCQNHNWCVDEVNTLISEVSYVNGNDKTCEGIKYKNIPGFSVQFIPVLSGGPQNTAALYDEFLAMIDNNKGVK